MEVVFEAVALERLERINWRARANQQYFVVPELSLRRCAGSSMYILMWYIMPPGSVEADVNCTTIRTTPYGFIDSSNGTSCSLLSPVFRTEEMAQDFACGLNLGRMDRLERQHGAPPLYLAESFESSVDSPCILGAIDQWVTDCYQRLVLDKHPLFQGTY